MKFIIDHDYHIHSNLSRCSKDEAQTPEAILAYAEKFGLRTICLTNHFWDEGVPGASAWYEKQNYAHISKALPLPQSDKVAFKFGCEGEMDKHLTVGITRERFESFDFVVIPTTHLHMMNFTIDPEDTSLEHRAELYVRRFRALCKMPLPTKKVGIAHLTCPLISKDPWESHLDVLDSIPDETFASLFLEAENRGFGIELNMPIFRYSSSVDVERALRPFRIAKASGCHFYLGSDAHTTKHLDGAMDTFEEILGRLDLDEDQKFRPFG